MKPTLKLLQTVVDRLSNTKHCCKGKLYGIFVKNALTIVGLQAETENGINLIHSFPTEIDFCGSFEVGEEDNNFDNQSIKKFVHDVDVTDNPIFISTKICQKNEIRANVVNNDQVDSITFSVISEQEFYTQFVHIRLKGVLPVQCDISRSSVEVAFESLRKSVTSGVMAFSFPKTNVYLLGTENENNIIGISGDPSVGELCEESNGLNEGVSRKKKTQIFDLEILNINILKRVSLDGSLNKKEHAAVCILDKKPQQCFNITLPIDSLSLVSRQTKVQKLYDILVESVVKYVKLYENVLLRNLQKNIDDISQPEAFHFYPQGCGHFVTRIYVKNDSDELLKEQRKLLHKQLLVACDRPLFRRGNAYSFKNEQSNGPLINPHEGVKPTDNGGQVALVKGKYQYYHYCQNKMDDNGWGCAYRSLQTLASWFKLQGYTDKEVPSFKDIQKCLVDIGDKTNNFIGSRQWIGSTEVNFVLNTLFGITSKILYVSSGEEMGSKGPELLNHFQTEGTPIMIGGGVLAHTILGVDYNQQSGDLRFLILDPHYTGGEDLHVILSKGWCGWKKLDFWDKTAYYNMCMPQVARGV